MKKIQVNTQDKSFRFELRQDGDRLFIKRDGAEHVADLVRLGNKRYSLILNGRSHEIGADFASDGYTIFSGFRSGRYVVEDYEIARMKKKAGIDDRAGLKIVSAPMPGLIVAVNCKPGDEIKKGEPLLVMEAMKMENDIRSPVAGKIEVVSVSAGENVDKGQTLVEFE
jgi:acetyl/propionyl-CoA carboxylase alpha subunit